MVRPSKTLLFMRITRREIRTNIKQFLAIIFIAALAVCLFSGLTANYMSLEKRVDTVYQQGNIADLFLYVNESDEEDLDFIKNDSRVEAVEKRLALDGEVNGKNTNIIIPNDNYTISTYSSLIGDEGVIIDSYQSSRYEIEIGDEVDISFMLHLSDYMDENSTLFNMLDRFLKEGKTNPFKQYPFSLKTKITGIMNHPESLENGAYATGKMLLTKSALFAAFDKLVDESFTTITNIIKVQFREIFETHANQYLIKLQNRDDNEIVADYLNDYFQQKEDNNLIILLTLNNLPSNATIQADIVQAKQLVLVFPVIFFVVAILVVLTSISQMIFKAREEIGTLKAIGFTSLEIILHYMSIGVVLSVMGAILGGLIGPLFIPNVLNIKYGILYNIPAGSIVMPWNIILLSILIFAGLSALVAFIVIRSEANLSPAESMRPRKIKDFKEKKNRSLNEKTLSLKMALRNIFLKKTRTLMVLLGVIGCTALLVSGFGILDTVNYGINKDVLETLQSDITVTYQSNNSIKDTLLEYEHVTSVEEVMVLPIRLSFGEKALECSMTLVEPNAHAYKMLDNLDDGVIIPQKHASTLGLKVGDQISFTVLGTTFTSYIDDIFDASIWLNAYACYKSFEDITFSPSQAHVFVDKEKSIDSVNEYIQTLDVASTTTKADFAAQAESIVSSITLMCNTVKVFAIALAIVVTYNLSLLNFNERKRDIATLKVLGFNRMEIFKSLSVELLLLSLIASVIGLMLGYPLLRLILDINQTNLFNYQYHIEISSYIISVMIALGTAFVVNLFLGRVANKVNAVEALKSVE